MIYLEFIFTTQNEIERSWLISILADYGFEGFEETDDSLKAYILSQKAGQLSMNKILEDNELSKIPFSDQQLEDKNWNAEWEKNFSPVIIAGRVGVRALFHAPLNTEFEITIEPKMSFGTGHHATTAGMMELMLKENFVNKNVLDFGSGTGLLAILAEKLKASKILAVDIDEWAYKNCVENKELNACVKIIVQQIDEHWSSTEKFDIILANINRNVVIQNISRWAGLLNRGGALLVSGVLLSDESDVMEHAKRAGLKLKDKLQNNGWLALSFGINEEHDTPKNNL